MFRSPIRRAGIGGGGGGLEREAADDVDSALLLSRPEKRSWVNCPRTTEKGTERKREITPLVLPSATSKLHQTRTRSASSSFLSHSGAGQFDAAVRVGTRSGPVRHLPLKDLRCKSTPAAGCVPDNARASENEL